MIPMNSDLTFFQTTLSELFTDSVSETYPQMKGGDRTFTLGNSHYRFGDKTKENDMM